MSYFYNLIIVDNFGDEEELEYESEIPIINQHSVLAIEENLRDDLGYVNPKVISVKSDEAFIQTACNECDWTGTYDLLVYDVYENIFLCPKCGGEEINIFYLTE
jgi:hypothetical protein